MYSRLVKLQATAVKGYHVFFTTSGMPKAEATN